MGLAVDHALLYETIANGRDVMSELDHRLSPVVVPMKAPETATVSERIVNYDP